MGSEPEAVSSHTTGPEGSVACAVRTPAERYDVVISGASAAGLALAVSLAHASEGGLRIALVERTWPPPSARGDVRAYAISAGSRHVLEQLGIWKEIEAGAQAVERIAITDSSLGAGIRPVLLEYDNTTRDGEPATHIVPGETIVSALAVRAGDFPCIVRLAPDQISGFAASPSGVRITTGAGRHLHAHLLVSAEGRQSPLRERAGIKIVSWTYKQTGIVTVAGHERPHEATAVQHFLPAGPFAILPLPGNRSCITWSEDSEAAQRILKLDDAAFLAEVELRFGGRLGAITLAGPRQSWPLGMHLARSYVAERFALIGDAAHGVHPIAGQGLNLALRDAAALAEVVIEAARVGVDCGNAEILTRYEKWRRFDSTVSAAAFDALNRVFSNNSAVLRAARDFGLGLVDRMPALKAMFVTEAAGLAGDVPRLMRGQAI